MANIFEILSQDGNITPEKARKSRQMQFHDKTAYVWGLRYRWDPSLSMNPVRQFAHFMPPWWKLTKQFTTFHHRVKENKAPSCNYYFSAEPFLLRPFVRESIGPISFLMKNGMFFFFTYRWIRAMFVLTFSPSGEKVNTNMVLVHREVKMSTLGKIVNNHRLVPCWEFLLRWYLVQLHVGELLSPAPPRPGSTWPPPLWSW